MRANLLVTNFWSTPAWDLRLHPGTWCQGSLRTGNASPAHREVIMVSQESESKAVMVILATIILAMVGIGVLASRYY